MKIGDISKVKRRWFKFGPIGLAAALIAATLGLWLPFRMDVSVERRVRCHSK